MSVDGSYTDVLQHKGMFHGDTENFGLKDLNLKKKKKASLQI